MNRDEARELYETLVRDGRYGIVETSAYEEGYDDGSNADVFFINRIWKSELNKAYYYLGYIDGEGDRNASK